MKHFKIFINFAIAACLACASIGSFAQVNSGGAGGVQSMGTASGSKSQTGIGFECSGGGTWKMDNGVARCFLPLTPAVVGAPCAAISNYSVGFCKYDIVSAPNGATVSENNKVVGYSGAITRSCSNGAWTTVTQTCVANPCPATTTSSGACTYTIAPDVSGHTSSAPNTTLGYTGSTNATCTTGTWSFSGTVCKPNDCAATTTTFGACTYSLPTTVSGNSTTQNTTTVNYVGSATGTCNTGVWAIGSQSCTYVPLPCAAKTVTSGACSYTLPASASGASVNPLTTTASYTGSIVGSCFDSTWTTGASTCVPNPCTGTTVTSGACSYPVAGVASGSTSTGSNTTANFSGSVTLTCTLGSWSAGAPTCVPTNCAAGTTTFGACNFSIAAKNSGSSVAGVLTGPVNYAGAITASCNNAVWSYSGGSCAPTNCTATTRNSGACSFNVPATTTGTSVPGALTGPAGYTGTSTATCTNASWSFSGETCVAPPASCAATTRGVGACSFSIAARASGQSVLGSLTGPAGYVGGTTASCNNGTWSYSAESCVAPPASCSGVVKNWGSCNYSFPALASGSTVTSPNFTAGFTGTLDGTCTNGSWSYSYPSCNAIPPANCSGTTRGVGACSFNIAGTVSGSSVAGSLTGPAGYTGGTTASCSNGSWSYSGESCVAPPPASCAATTRGVGACSFNIAARASGASAAGVLTGPAGYSGGTTGTCNNGSWSYSGESCVAPVGCSATTHGFLGCSFNIPAAGNGGFVAGTLTGPAGYGGSSFGTCNNGTWSYSGEACTPPASCSGGNWNIGSCTYPLPPRTSGTSTGSIATSSASYNGAMSATCNNGSWTGISSTCTIKQCAATTVSTGIAGVGDMWLLPVQAVNTSKTVSGSADGSTNQCMYTQVYSCNSSAVWVLFSQTLVGSTCP